MAPAGVLGDHTLNTGGRILISHRFNTQNFDGLLNGTQSVSAGSVHGAFPLAPTRATHQMHYFLFEFGPSDDLTFQFILPIFQQRMHFSDAAGNDHISDITDPYDVQFNMMYVLWREERHQVHLNLGLQAPLGIFDEQ